MGITKATITPADAYSVFFAGPGRRTGTISATGWQTMTVPASLHGQQFTLRATASVWVSIRDTAVTSNIITTATPASAGFLYSAPAARLAANVLQPLVFPTPSGHRAPGAAANSPIYLHYRKITDNFELEVRRG